MKKKTAIRIVLIAIVAIILLYLVMLLDTNPVVRYVEDIFYGKIPDSELEGTPLTYYNFQSWNPDTKTVELDLRRTFVIHNGYKGFIWVKYECEAYDESGNLTFGSKSWGKWTIQKVDGEWQIVDIYEPL